MTTACVWTGAVSSGGAGAQTLGVSSYGSTVERSPAACKLRLVYDGSDCLHAGTAGLTEQTISRGGLDELLAIVATAQRFERLEGRAWPSV